MIDTIRKTMLAGVGAAVVTREKLEQTLGEWVKSGKVSADEARSFAEKIAEEGRKEFETMADGLGARIHDVMDRSQSDATRRIAALEERVRKLEERVMAEPVHTEAAAEP